MEVARYAALRQYDASILDTFIPRCRRLTQLHFGKIVSNPDAPMAFSENMGYNMTYNLVEPFKGNALHTHPAVEIFIALDGRWEIAWGAHGEQSTVLEPFDLVAVPEHVRHSYKNIEPHTAQNIMTILPGKASITWAPEVVSEARKHGARCTDDGVLIDFWSKTGTAATETSSQDSQHERDERDHPELDEGSAAHGAGKEASDGELAAIAPSAAAAWHVPVTDAAMAKNVRRHSDGQPLVVQTPHGHLRVSWRTLGGGERLHAREITRDHASDLLLVILGGAADLRRGHELLGTVTRLDAVRIPASATPVTLINQLAAPCMLLVVESQMRALVGRQCDSWIIGAEMHPFGSISPSSTLDTLETRAHGVARG